MNALFIVHHSHSNVNPTHSPPKQDISSRYELQLCVVRCLDDGLQASNVLLKHGVTNNKRFVGVVTQALKVIRLDGRHAWSVRDR